MTRLFPLLLGLAILIAADAAPAMDPVDAASAAVLRVRAHYADGGVARGSAVIIGPERLVTNCHVIHGSGRIEVVQGELAHPAVVQATFASRDMCLLDAPGVKGSAPPQHAEVAVGQRIFAVGFPAGRPLTITEGQVVALHDYDGAKVIQGSAPFEFGCSGGALFDEHGRLVGITTFKERQGGPYHFALPVAWLEDSVASPREPGVSGAAGAFWQRRAEELPQFLRAVLLKISTAH